MRPGPREGVAHLIVSKAALRRALLYLQAIFTEAERRGWEVAPSRGYEKGVAIVIRGHPYPIAMHELHDRAPIALGSGQHVRLVQIGTPEVYFGTECSGPQASTATKRLLPIGTRVRLMAEPTTDRIDQYGRLLRYVIRARDGLDVNVRLVAMGAAAPYFYDGRRGMYAKRLEVLARRARTTHLGLWGACPRTPYDPYHGVQTRR
jgi:endonuclease YncB( thermonuclease family)